ncbi:hypothetical protein [Pseudonocardia nigra]|uniref:hypothetical protein n=1 Tax=Pseudonocardia nigra TaxID=1921578 RepID=UPI001C5DADCE|nr:hypothetical protein [Pseudonocardia nigra]
MDAFEQDGRGLIGGVLGNEAAGEGVGEERPVKPFGQQMIERYVQMEPAQPAIELYEGVNQLSLCLD